MNIFPSSTHSKVLEWESLVLRSDFKFCTKKKQVSSEKWLILNPKQCRHKGPSGHIVPKSNEELKGYNGPFFAKEFQLTKVERIIGLGKSPFYLPQKVIKVCKSHQVKSYWHTAFAPCDRNITPIYLLLYWASQWHDLTITSWINFTKGHLPLCASGCDVICRMLHRLSKFLAERVQAESV